MGTNYYWKPEGQEKSIHIGKSSRGWCFALHVTEELKSLDDWKAEWENPGRIRDEYGETITPGEMLQIITCRAWFPSKIPFGYDSWEHFYESNHAEPGPRGLHRRKTGQYCVGHGEGTWDLCPGRFS